MMKRRYDSVQVISRVKSPITALVEAATSGVLIGPDYDLNIKICHEVNLRPEISNEVVRALQTSMRKNSTVSKLLSLELADTLVRSCGMELHHLIASEDFMQDMFQLIKTTDNNVDEDVSARAVAIMQCWGESFKNYRELFPLYFEKYRKLKFQGLLTNRTAEVIIADSECFRYSISKKQSSQDFSTHMGELRGSAAIIKGIPRIPLTQMSSSAP